MNCKESLLRKQERDTQLRCLLLVCLEKLQEEVGGHGECLLVLAAFTPCKVTSGLDGGLVNLEAPGQRGSLICKLLTGDQRETLWCIFQFNICKALNTVPGTEMLAVAGAARKQGCLGGTKATWPWRKWVGRCGHGEVHGRPGLRFCLC